MSAPKPSYQTPYPVKRQDGSEIIWDWGKQDWIPYDRAKANAPAPPPVAANPGEPPGNAPGGMGPAPGSETGAGRAPGGSSPGGGGSPGYSQVPKRIPQSVPVRPLRAANRSLLSSLTTRDQAQDPYRERGVG